MGHGQKYSVSIWAIDHLYSQWLQEKQMLEPEFIDIRRQIGGPAVCLQWKPHHQYSLIHILLWKGSMNYESCLFVVCLAVAHYNNDQRTLSTKTHLGPFFLHAEMLSSNQVYDRDT